MENGAITTQARPKIQLQKTITIETNFCGKLGNSTFIHIDLAPTKPVNESLMDRTTVTIKTADGSHPPVQVKLYDLARFELWQLCLDYTMTSHGMSRTQFVNYLFKKYLNLNIHTPLAAYFYKRTDTGCTKPCGPGDWYKGGKCDTNGCFHQ